MRGCARVVVAAAVMLVVLGGCKRTPPPQDPDQQAVVAALAKMDAALAGGDLGKVREAFHDVGAASIALGRKLNGAAALGFGRILVDDVEPFRGELETSEDVGKLKARWTPIGEKMRKAL